MNFASDNASPAHPNVIEAISRANHDFVGSYGSDPIMQRVRQQIRDIFEAPDAAVYLVATGSAANALALATYCPPWGAVYCHDVSHIEMDECGAPEFYTGGAKLAKISGAHAKIDPDALEHALASAAAVGVHNVQRGMLSLSNVTELGACYSADELSALCGLAKQYDLPVHLDGARFANALVATGATPAELSWRAGVDVLSFGGTKNGLMGVEAVVMFDPAKAWEFELRRKRGGHLFSKHRYLSAQMEAYLTDDLWLEMAGQANAMGSALAEGLGASNVAHLLHPADANMIFVSLPAGRHR
ncbi:MAG: beta-eliminating lyase-related protein, partial [Pseudomonadota bacterium]